MTWVKKAFFLRPDKATGSIKTLRIIHQFIQETDMPALYTLAQKGSLGGAGDHTTIRSLYGEYPMFIDIDCDPNTCNDDPRATVFIKIRLLKKTIPKNYRQLHKWFNALLCLEYSQLLPLVKDEQLLREWHWFRTEAVKEADLGPWVERYVKYCIIHRLTRPWLEKAEPRHFFSNHFSASLPKASIFYVAFYAGTVTAAAIGVFMTLCRYHNKS